MKLPKWRWIDKQLLLIFHDESLVLQGGASGMRDEVLLDSALDRAKNMALYGTPDFADLALAYVFGLAGNQPFIDGNKRVAFLALGLFLGINGYELSASPVDVALIMMAVAAGEIKKSDFADWLRSNTVYRTEWNC